VGRGQAWRGLATFVQTPGGAKVALVVRPSKTSTTTHPGLDKALMRRQQERKVNRKTLNYYIGALFARMLASKLEVARRSVTLPRV
jgi:hypothetical protein